ncbi:uncharacterized protein LOC131064892 [Cryptomeria japonica]|uniref:uncharacterized protein LOC131064892 n=1 Tax=Cryptomeria japonica TaxID=3369 RepID=UPI0027DA64C5|nr:uncharacterized protein LOC131064892 [Cryptomeria japonica]
MGCTNWRDTLSDSYNNDQGWGKGRRIEQGSCSAAMTATEPTSSKKTRNGPKVQKDSEGIMAANVAFESMTGSECRNWWEETPLDHVTKDSLRRAQVDHAIQMPTFNIKEFEPILRTMVSGYNPQERASVIQFQGCTVRVSFKPEDFRRVFGIPEKGASAAKPTKKLTKEKNKWLMDLVRRDDLTEEQWKSAWGDSRRMKRVFIAPGEWRMLMDLVKSRLIGASRASDIAIWMIGLMNGIKCGKVYNWGQLLAERIHDFLRLEHKMFYMCHHAISLFLDVVRLQVPPEIWGTFEPRGRVEPNKPTMYYYIHLDTLGDTTQPTKKRRKLHTSIEVEDVSSAEDSSEEVEMTEDQESGDEGFHLAGHIAVEEEGETESQQQEEEEEEQQGGLRAQWKSTRVKFTPSKLSSAHLVPQEALAVASPMGDVRPIGVLFQKINEGEPPAQRRVSLPQISLVILTAKPTESTTVIGTTNTGIADLGTADIGTIPAGTGTVPARTGMCASDTGTIPADTGTTPASTSTAPAGKETGNIQMTEGDLEAVAALDTLMDEDIDASLDGWLGQFALALHLPPSLAPHNMAIGARMTPDRGITISNLDGGKPVEREHQNLGSDKQSSGPEGALAGLHITPPNPNDPAGSLRHFLGELQGLSNVACSMAQLTGQMEAGNSADATQLCHFMTTGCTEEFTRHLEQQGWLDHSTPEMIQNWTHGHLVGGTGTLDTTFCSMERVFQDVYLQMRQHQVEQEAQQMYITTLEKEGEKQAQLATVEKNLRKEMEMKMTTYEARCSMQEKEAQALAAQVAELTSQLEQKDKKLLEAAHMVKKARERQLLAEKNLKLHARQQPSPTTTTGTPPPSSRS